MPLRSVLMLLRPSCLLLVCVVVVVVVSRGAYADDDHDASEKNSPFRTWTRYMHSDEENDDFWVNLNVSAPTPQVRSSSSSGQHGKCPPRIRKAWHKLTKVEQDMYLEAVSMSLEKKYNVYFTDLHMDSMSSVESHDTCAFLVWHRTFTIGYENMLRSLDHKFRCITVPYWDIFHDYAKMMNGECNNMEECSEFLQAMGGGGIVGTEKEVSIHGKTFNNTGCCTKPPCDLHCESLNQCSQCIPRGNWLNTTLPPTADYASIVVALLRSKNYERANKRIQRGVHNDFHDTAGGAFGTYASSSDPIFFPFHATIDMLHYIYYKCTAKRDEMSGFEKRFSKRAFMKCSYGKHAKSPGARSMIQMLVRHNGQHMYAQDHPVLGPFFRGLGTKYYQMVDPTELSEFSYNYDMDLLVRRMLDMGLKCKHPAWKRSGRRRLARRKLSNEALVDRDHEGGAVSHYFNWYKEAHRHVMDDNSNDFVQTAVQLEAMTCATYHERFTEREGFSEAFKEGFNMQGTKMLPRCRHILRRIEQKQRQLPSDWRQVMRPFLEE